MFNSLKKKIKEETGTDPTKVISNVFKVRTASDSDLIESRAKPIVGKGVFVDEHCDETRANRSLPVSPLNGGVLETNNSFTGALENDLKHRPSKEECWPAGRDVEAEEMASEESYKLCNEIGVNHGGYEQQIGIQVKNGLTKTLENSKEEEEKKIMKHTHPCSTTDIAEVCEINVSPEVFGVKDDRESERQKHLDNITVQLRKTEEQLYKARQQLEESNNRCSQLSTELLGEKNTNAQLNLEMSHLQNDIKEQSGRFEKMGESLDQELREKDVMLLRNAQLNQDVEMTKQELRLQEAESYELQAKLAALNETIMEKDKELRKKSVENEELCRRVKELLSEEQHENAFTVEQELRRNIIALEEQLAEKVKSIRVLQQHSNDLKKTLQRELKQSVDEPPGDSTSAASTTPSETDVNFKYLKHVIMKFLTSREYEAQHLTRAVSTLLHFSPEEERLLRETLDWKMSWFGTRPQLGFGQSSKTIPPS